METAETLNTLVVLVDLTDREIGIMEKIEVHRKGLLHRAVSVVILNSSGHWLLQRRASAKYHSPGQWANACCSHPVPDELPSAAALRRLREELGIHCALAPWFSFIYRADMDNGLIEHELDHVFFGVSDDLPSVDHKEVEEFRYAEPSTIVTELEQRAHIFAPWFRILFEQATLRPFPHQVIC